MYGRSRSMMEDEHKKLHQSNQRSGSRNGILCRSRTYKKPKQKKTPQRGLGVAQLERIRLEEQQKKEAVTVATQPCFILPHPSNVASAISRSARIPSYPPLPYFTGRNFSRYPEGPDLFSFSKNKSTADRKDAIGAGSQSALRFHLGDTPVLLPETSHSQQFPVLVNDSSSPSLASSSNLLMEPPSNQSYCSNPTSSWPQEMKMVGGRPFRCLPFQNSSPMAACLPCNFTSVTARQYLQDDMQTLREEYECDGKGTQTSYDPCDNIMSYGEFRAIDRVKGIENVDDGFLSLGPSVSLPFSPGFKEHSQRLASSVADEDFPGGYISLDDAIDGLRDPQPRQPEPTFYRFLPIPSESDVATPIGEIAEQTDDVDLSLKL